MPCDRFSRRTLLAACAGALAPWPGAARAALERGPERGPERGFPPRRAWPAGRPTPPLALPAWEGAPVRLAELAGQVVVVNFWASWCEPCRTEMPSLELLAAAHEAEGLQVLAVNHRETDGAIRRYLQTWPITLPILRDTDGAASIAWQVRAFPTTFVVGRRGGVLFSVAGEVDWQAPTARGWIRDALRA